MATKLQTAEEMISFYRETLLARLTSTQTLAATLHLLDEPLRAKLSAEMDDTEELGVAVAALDVALLELTKPMQPVRDELRG